jgi:hypothetical protein
MSDYNRAEEHFNMMGGHNGLAHTQNPALKWYDNYAFRSVQEIAYYQALVRKRKIEKNNFIFWVNSVCAQPGSKRKEFDFLICSEGTWLRVEIDGDSHNEELAYDRDESEKWLHENLVVTKRFRSYSTDDQAWADECVDQTFQYINKIKTRRFI